MLTEKGQRDTPRLKERALTKEVFEEKELTNPERTHTQILKNNCKRWGETQKMTGESWLFYLNMSIFHAKAEGLRLKSLSTMCWFHCLCLWLYSWN